MVDKETKQEIRDEYAVDDFPEEKPVSISVS